MEKSHKRRAVIAAIMSFVFTAMQIVGYRISGYYKTTMHKSAFFPDMSEWSGMQYAVFAVIEYIFWMVVLSLLFGVIEKRILRKKKCNTDRNGKCGVKREIVLWLATAGLLFVCWIPCYLASYPGFYNYDAFSQVPQALYEEVPYSAHHPLIHTLIMGKIMLFGLNHGADLNDGIALYSLFQMVFCACIFSYVICYLRRSIGRLWICIAAFGYYALFPLISMFAVSTTKDTMFSSLLLLSVIFVYEMCKNPEDFFATKWKIARLEIILLFMCLFRKNGIYGVIGAALFILFFYKEYRKQFVCLFGVELMGFLLISRGLVWALDAEEGSAEEMLSVPMQQVARVYHDCGETAFTEEELSMIYEGISEEALLNYDPFLADNIKNYFDFNVILEHKAEYLWLWAEKGIAYPGIYIRAFLDNTYQAWYPWTSVYDKPGETKTKYFSVGMCPGGYRDSRLPGLLSFYEKIASEYYYQKIPVVRMLFSIGAMLWIVLFALGFAVYQKNRRLVVAMLFVLCYCLTVFMGPISLVRYYLILFYGLPVNIGYLLTGEGDNGKR